MEIEFTEQNIPIRNERTQEHFPRRDIMNEERDHDELRRWWNVPFVDELSYIDTGLIGVYVLDGATWDCPRKISEHKTMAEAASAAHFYHSHSSILRAFDEPYRPTAKVGHLLEMSSLINGKLGKPTEQELFEFMFKWLPEETPEATV
ncbi:hypothetical protein MD588_08345 [Photobacterium sp. SDRW27]|uniref:hypothetical protein n=1 Tax=Photobacterium obscurum TaxID=2829490 RepID=UPI002243D6F3|nr:hypothetical protein [Photobacterium obscurum]MCW8328817.1 hypothetical protein [Photobacterium obscurum]